MPSIGTIYETIQCCIEDVARNKLVIRCLSSDRYLHARFQNRTRHLLAMQKRSLRRKILEIKTNRPRTLRFIADVDDSP